MNKYVCCPRRGLKVIDQSGNIIRDDWADYEKDPDYIKPHDGELVIEFEVNLKTDTKIPRIKFGDGARDFKDLPYMSADSFILPTPASITLSPTEWKQVVENGESVANRYYQPVTVKNAVITPNSKVDLQPSPEQLAIFHEKDITFTAINRGGNVRVCVVGQQPTQEYTIQATVTEVAVNGIS